MARSNIEKLALVCLISCTVPPTTALRTAVSAAHAVGLFERATCGGDSSLEQCGSNLPSDFCCPSNTNCLILNSTISQSVICCGKGDSCDTIAPITCDITQQDASKHPGTLVQTSNLTASLPTCGSSQCCPLGYICKDNSQCQMDYSVTSATTMTLSSSAIPSSTSTVSQSSTSAPSTTNTAAPATTTAPLPFSKKPNRNTSFSGSSFAAGFIPGIILGALLVALIIFLLLRRRKQSYTKYTGSARSSITPVTRNISDPIYDPQTSARTDFMRRKSAQPSPSYIPFPMAQRSPPPKIPQPTLESPFRPSASVGSRGQESPDFYTPTRPPLRRASNRITNADKGLPLRHLGTPTPLPRIVSLFHRSPTKGKGEPRPDLSRSGSNGSTATIDVLMPRSAVGPGPGQGFLDVPGQRASRGTQHTTFTDVIGSAEGGNGSRWERRL